MNSRMFLEAVASKPVVGSSRSSMGGSGSRVLAKAEFAFHAARIFLVQVVSAVF